MNRRLTYRAWLGTPEWTQLSKTCKDRDNWTCQKCGETKGPLHAHHKRYPKDFRDTTLDHLQTLCKDCHERHHRRFQGREERLEAGISRKKRDKNKGRKDRNYGKMAGKIGLLELRIKDLEATVGYLMARID